MPNIVCFFKCKRLWFPYFSKLHFFPKPPDPVCQQNKANDKDNQIQGIGLIAQINGCEWIVGDMDDDARDDASRAPVEPASEYS